MQLQLIIEYIVRGAVWAHRARVGRCFGRGNESSGVTNGSAFLEKLRKVLVRRVIFMENQFHTRVYVSGIYNTENIPFSFFYQSHGI